MTPGSAVGLAAGSIAAGVGGLRWLRVAQREHYLPGSVTRFALRWARSSPLNGGLPVAGVALTGATAATPWAGVGAAAVVAAWPAGLGLRGRTSRLAWTRRMRTLAGVAGVLEAAGIAGGAVAGAPATAAAAGALLVPLAVDAACAITAPVERRLGARYVRSAASRLRSVRPTVVAITGSYGKTTTKGYVAHLVSAARTVVATPRSFNNRAGLARSVNENLGVGTEVFVAEMGTYGKGEIAELCSFIPPDVSVITAIGPVHLERMGSEDAIAEAKSEILEKARVAVLNVDDSRLAAIAEAERSRRKVVTCSTRRGGGDVTVHRADGGLVVEAGGDVIATVADPPRGDGRVPDRLPPMASNLACAVAVALELGVPRPALAERLSTVPPAPNRLTATTGAKGFLILDDTYNSNPAGCRAALETLEAIAPAGGRRVVVTPGMVELGRRQYDENREFARQAAAVATHLVIVGRVNRRALLDGSSEGAAQVVTVGTRQEAVAWVKDHLGPADAVLYENDLPDHYP
ncbi:MAG TPA: UDP-N-acetylmuramoyl-tripeptide--D-alanyl-D-alanine ligase [Acidimicrobiales bacterium]|nr:UDP-N-acetylmuramoyl-tripeptide--D-alanyl-D-alanine ligase [Acidimicrobiales bacterium]